MNWQEASAVAEVCENAMSKVLVCVELLQQDESFAVRITPINDWDSPEALVVSPAEAGAYIQNEALTLRRKAEELIFGIHGEKVNYVPLPIYPERK